MTLIALFAAAAMAASPLPQARLADASCDRLAEGLTAFHAETLQWEQRALSLGGEANPDVAAMTRRMQAVARYMAARNLSPRGITETDGILFNSTDAQMMTEFERRCRT